MLRSSALCGLSFRARFGTTIGLLVMCTDNGRILLANLSAPWQLTTHSG